MHIDDVCLDNFRNYEREKIVFSPGTNIIFGKNAQGKTNILEAVYYFSAGQSHRTAADKELIRFGEQRGRISLSFAEGGREQFCEIDFFADKQKKIKKNGVLLKNTAELIGSFKAVLFSPEELSIIKGGPEQRRRFLDRAITPLRPNYINILRAYNKILSQKNMLLKGIRAGKKRDETLPVWDEKLSEYGARIRWYRKAFLEKIAEGAREINSDITSGKEELEIFYRPDNCPEDMREAADFKKQMRERIFCLAQREREMGAALVGPHRDDVLFITGGKNTRQFASQGQQRTAVLSVKIAQMELIKNEIEEYPVLLLDDIMSELDEERREYLKSRIKGKQVILTCTDGGEGEENARQFQVDNGRIVQKN